jgi:hypothetical protein
MILRSIARFDAHSDKPLDLVQKGNLNPVRFQSDCWILP